MATRNHKSRRWFDRANRHHTHNHHKQHNRWSFGLLAVIALASPAIAEEGDVYSTAQPQAAATSNNTNQSVQINQTGSSSRQQFGGGLSCNGPTFNLTNFYLGNDSISSSYQRSNNWGVQAGVTIPLDGSVTEMCKQMVRRRLEKERLDYELVRGLRCAELLDRGYTFRPDHPLFVVCEHVVSIESWRLIHKDSPSAPTLLLPTSSKPSSSQASKPSASSAKQVQPPSSPQPKPLPPLQQILQPW